MKKLLSAFSLNMLSFPSGGIKFESIRRPDSFEDFESFVGMPQLARELGVECNRSNIKLNIGEEVVIANANVRGLHRDEDLPAGTNISFYRLELI